MSDQNVSKKIFNYLKAKNLISKKVFEHLNNF